MNISELSIKRPVTVIMMMLIIVVLGVVSFMRVPIDLMPSLEVPMAIVVTNYEGAGPQEVENFVTRNIENALGSVNNMKSIQSQTSEGNSVVIVEFNDGTDMDFATLQMREKIDLIRGFLPDGTSDPMVLKLDPNMLPVVQIGVFSSTQDDIELKQYVEDIVKMRLERLDGVGSVNVTGGVEREIQVELDPDKLTGYGVSFNQVVSMLQSENINLPGGSVEYGSKNLIVKSMGEFSSVSEIREVPIALPSGGIVYLYDLAEITDGLKSQSTYTRMNQENSVGVSIQKQTTANTVAVVNLVKDEIEQIKKDNPEVDIQLVFDQGQFVELAISNVSTNAVMGALLAVLILFIFLRNLRTTLIIGIAIPVSIITTFILMYLADTTLNLISMGGLALGVGMMVDNSIVVLENIFRHRQQGEGRFHAAIKGAKEVGGAITASTLTTVVVFLPIIFTEGMAAQIFKEMALTVTFSLLASLAVALTVVPMLSSKMLAMAKTNKPKRTFLDAIFDGWENFFNKIDQNYQRILVGALKRRKLTVLVALVILVTSIFAVPLIGVEFIPATDQGQFTVSIALPEGTQLEETNLVTEQVERILSDTPEVEKLFTTVGGGDSMMMSSSTDSHVGSISATLVPKGERKLSTAEVVEAIRNQVKLIPGAEIDVTEVSMMLGGGASGMGGDAISVEISGFDFEKLGQISAEVEEKIQRVEGTRQISSSISDGRPEAQIFVDKNKASQYGITNIQVASAIRSALQGQVATRYRVDGDEIDVRVLLPEDQSTTFEHLQDLKFTSPAGAVMRLGDLIDIQIEEGPVSIARKNQVRYVTVSSELFDRDVGSATDELQIYLDELVLPEGYDLTIGGQYQQIVDAFSSLVLALILSLLLIYMVMAAQFESLIQPFIIMFSVPLAFSGAAIGLALTGRTFNVPAFIGIIMLSGIVVNNAIILIDYINMLRHSGHERNEAIIKAGPTRLRPILMTTLTTVLAMIPMSLGLGEGGEMQAPLATVIIFGLSLSTMLTLLIVPVTYTLFDDLAVRLRKTFKKKEQIN